MKDLETKNSPKVWKEIMTKHQNNQEKKYGQGKNMEIRHHLSSWWKPNAKSTIPFRRQISQNPNRIQSQVWKVHGGEP